MAAGIAALPQVAFTNSSRPEKKGTAPWVRVCFLCFFVLLCYVPRSVHPAFAQESPYIVTYDHYLEEPGSLEVEYFSTAFGTTRAEQFSTSTGS